MIDRTCRACALPREDVLESRLIWPVAAMLGEGPAWIDDALWFVDIKGGAIHRLDPATGERRSLAVGGAPSFVVPTDGDALLVGDGTTLRLLEGDTLSAPIATVPMPAHNRTNDATVDRSGRLWFGTMDDGEERPTGLIYRYDGRGIVPAGGGCTITNGPAISPDGRFLYHVDTLAGTITRFAITPAGELADAGPFAAIAPQDGNPDGVTIDAEGCLWVALWGGGAVRRYSPEGELIATVPIPAANVTKIAFGGPGLATAFVTTARAGLSPAALAAQPATGGLFAFDPPAPGLPLPAVRLGR